MYRCDSKQLPGRTHWLKWLLLVPLLLWIFDSLLEPLQFWVEQSLGTIPGLLPLVLVLQGLMMAIPFVPAIEFGLLLLTLLDRSLIPLVYLASVAGLYAAYLTGRHLPTLRRQLPAAMERLLPGEQQTRSQWHNGMLLLVLFNAPGNCAIGGGGGISMLYGVQRALNPTIFLFSAAVATCPVPLLFMLL